MGCIRDKPLKTFCSPTPADDDQGRRLEDREGEDSVAVVVTNGPHKGEVPRDKVSNFSNVVVDERMPLSVRQCFCLVQSWRGIKRNMSMTGVEMFLK